MNRMVSIDTGKANKNSTPMLLIQTYRKFSTNPMFSTMTTKDITRDISTHTNALNILHHKIRQAIT